MEGDRHMDWKTLLAYITGTVDQELLLRNEYLVTENRILRNQLKGRVRFSNSRYSPCSLSLHLTTTLFERFMPP